MRVDFPAPEGPMMPISSLLLNRPDKHLRRALKPDKEESRQPIIFYSNAWLILNNIFFTQPRC